MNMHDHQLSILSTMHPPFDNLASYEPPRPRFIFKMPRVVPEQKNKFESDELFRRLSRESEVRYTGHRDRPQEERVKRFLTGCHEGHTEVAFATTGTNLNLVFESPAVGYMTENQCDFQKEQGKVNIKSSFIMNGVCVRWRGWFDLERLDGLACLEFDEDNALREDAILREQMERYSQRLRDFEVNKTTRYHHPQHHHHRVDRPETDEVRLYPAAAPPSTLNMSVPMPGSFFRLFPPSWGNEG